MQGISFFGKDAVKGDSQRGDWIVSPDSMASLNYSDGANQVKNKLKSPPRYPPGNEPKITDAEREAILKKKLPTERELRDVQEDIDRKLHKIKWSIHQPNRDDRQQSAEAGLIVALHFVYKEAHVGRKHRENQRKKGQVPRIQIFPGEALNSIIDKLAWVSKDNLGDWIPSRDIWPEFYSVLDHDELKLEPEEVEHPTDSAKTYIRYTFKGKRRTIRFGTFENRVSKARKSTFIRS